MDDQTGTRLRWPILALSAVALIAIGAAGAYLVLPRMAAPMTDATPSQKTPEMAAPSSEVDTAQSPMHGAPLTDVVVPLTDNAITRAGIEVATVGTTGGAAPLRIPGTVQPNAYRSIVVTPLVAGRVTRVFVELGQHVTSGQTLAEIYSPELAEAQTRFLASQAELSAHEQELQRTEKLVAIGAASRQELEKIHAEHAAATTVVESNRARLTLLGMTEADVAKLAPSSPLNSSVRVPAPIGGVITTRDVNVGLNVDPAMKLLTVVDLSSVWVEGDLYERDFSSVRVGSRATVTTTAYPDRTWDGKVSYIDPQVKPDTRTAQVRVEVSNPKGDLRLGMYAEMHFGEGNGQRSTAVTIPRNAVQVVADRSVVYVVNPQEHGRFIEREVRLGDASGDDVQVVSGIQPGDVVVAKGSFYVRAERERLGLRPPSTEAPRETTERTSAAPATGGAAPGVQTAHVTVSDMGYEPSRLSLRAGVPARLTFLRTSDKTCGTEVTIPSLNIRRALPLNEPVDIDLTPTKGEIAFVCGMAMLKGTIVVQ